jgi:formylglycine-generating enzyme required for sulfatase activity
VDYVKIPTTNNVSTNQLVSFNSPPGMAFVPAGLFTIGDTLDGTQEARPTNVIVSAFYMELNPVSYNQWRPVYDWATNHGYSFTNSGFGKALNHPVLSVNWFDAVKWCNARSEQEGLTPVYRDGFWQVYKAGHIHALADWMAEGYRLPTEAEWEKAARGGLSGKRFPWGDTISHAQANYGANTFFYSYDLGPDGFHPAFQIGAQPYTNPGGYFAPNGYGIYDMAGNIFQWCWDWWWPPYQGGTDPHGPDGKSERVLRGGAYNNPAPNARCSNRGAWGPSQSDITIGFRCVRRF